jgi:phosphoglycerate kinase
MLLEKYKIHSLNEVVKSLTGIETAIVRVDFNITIEDKKILDPSRILATLPTIQFLLEKKIKPVLISHLGDNLSFQPIIEEISHLLKLPIDFAKNLEELEKILSNKSNIKPLLLDNIRFYPGEKNKDLDLAKKLAKISPLYINDAFSVCHRDHTSITLLPELAQIKVAGLSLVEELTKLEELFYKENHQGKRIALIGGKKISTKLPLLEALLQDFDQVLVMGAMANTFLKALGYDLDQSYFEGELLDQAKLLLKSNKILLPSDFISRDQGKIFTTEINQVKGQIVDLGPVSQAYFARVIQDSSFVVWNGPAGLYEEGFFQGTKTIAEAIGRRSLLSIAGGGDTLALLKNLNLEKNLSYISKAGGAFLAWLVDNFLPGLIKLKNK